METKGDDPYRICILLEKQFLWPNDDENGEYNVYRTIPKVSNKKPNMRGLAYSFLEDMFGIVFDGSFNYTLHGVEHGFKREGFPTTCFESLHQNVTDISIIPTTIPLPYDNIGIAGVLGETKMAFLSGYEYDDTFTNSDVTESIYMFNLIQWTVIGSTFLVLALFLYLHSLSPCNVLRQIMKSPGRAVTKVIDFLMEIMHNIMGQSVWEFQSVYQRLILLTFAFFTFMFITGYNSFVKTDLVSLKTPIVPYSYQDIIDNVSLPVWMPKLDDVEDYLRTSPVGSIERNFYEAIQSKKLEDGPMSGRFTKPRILSGINLTSTSMQISIS